MKHSNDPFWVVKFYSMIHFVILHFLDKIMTVFIDKSKQYDFNLSFFLKLFISILSSFSICCFIFHSQIRKNNSFEMITRFNYSLSLLALILPIFFYYSIYFSINYSGIYIFFALVYFINYIIYSFKKYG